MRLYDENFTFISSPKPKYKIGDKIVFYYKGYSYNSTMYGEIESSIYCDDRQCFVYEIKGKNVRITELDIYKKE